VVAYQVKCEIYAACFDEGHCYGFSRGIFSSEENAYKAIEYLKNLDKNLPIWYKVVDYWVDSVDIDTVLTIIPRDGCIGGFDKKHIPIEEL